MEDVSMEDDRSASVGVAFLQGAFLGAIAALLLAPRTGRELRQQLRDNLDKAVERGKEYADRGRDYAERGLEKGREAGREVAEKGRQYAEKGREYAQRKASEVRDAYQAGREAVEGEESV
jgi:gas vesicle protein